MPLRLNVGVSRKVGLPDYCSVGASCNVEIELSQELLDHDLQSFQDRVRTAYVAAHQAVHDELTRLQQPPVTPLEPLTNGVAPARITNGRHTAPSEPPHVPEPHGRTARPPSRAPRSYATIRQIGALRAIARQTGADLAGFIHEEFGVERPEQLTVQQASQLIDDLKAASES